MAGLQFNQTGFDQKNMLLFACSQAVELKPVKMQTNCTVILPQTVSVIWFKHWS